MRTHSLRSLKVLVASGVSVIGVGFTSSVAVANSSSAPTFHVSQILQGTALQHSYTPAGSATSKIETLSKPDDISQLGNDLFVGFQNGVGPQGEASTDGNLESTVVELSTSGHVLGQWDVVGKTDGLTADPALGGVLATVNEDANSSLYLIRPGLAGSGAVTHYTYSAPLAHDGGTDAVSLFNDQILISASAPGTTGSPSPSASSPAVYSVRLDAGSKMAVATPLYFDEDTATVANQNGAQWGKTTQLALTDPDSNEVVPKSSPRFAGDFLLTSQGDLQQIYFNPEGGSHPRLLVLALTQAVDDTAWPTTHRSGKLYSTDSTNNAVDVVTGDFDSHQPLVVATPCGSNSAPATCPAPPTYPNNYLATLNLKTGQVSAVTVTGAPYVPEGGLTFASSADH